MSPWLGFALLTLAVAVSQCSAAIGAWECHDRTTLQTFSSGAYYSSDYAPIDFATENGKYRGNMRCNYHVNLPNCHWGAVYFSQLQLDADCEGDFIHITDPIPFNYVENVCGIGTPMVNDFFFISRDHYVDMLFQTDGVNELAGIIGGVMYKLELYDCYKRSPDVELAHQVAIKRSAGAIPLPSNMLDMGRFKSWVKNLKSVVSDISLRAAKLETAGDKDANADAEDDDNDDADSVTANDSKVSKRKPKETKVAVSKPNVHDYVSQKRLDAMRDLTCITKFQKHCGTDAERMAQDLAAMCIEKLEK